MATIIGVLHLELHVPQANSLKDKRRIVKGFKDRLRHRGNVSVAEVGYLETHRRCELAVAMVSNERKLIESALQAIVNQAAMHRDMILLDQQMEWY